MPGEEYRKLIYCIEYKSSEISDEEVIPFVKQTIEEAKKKFPEKAKALDRIEIREGIRGFRLAVDVPTTLIIEVILAPIIVETWRKIVIPLLERKLNIKPYEDYLKKIEEKIAELKKEKINK